MTREYPPEVYGGAGVHVGALVPQLAQQVEVEVHCMGAPRQGAVAHREDFPPDANPALRVFGADLDMVSSLGAVDVVHSHTWYANLAGFLAGRFQGIPHVITAHSLEPLRPWKREQLGGGYALSSWAEANAYADAAALIAVSSAMRDDIERVYPNVDPALLHVVYNGIDTSEFYPDDAHEYCAQIGFDIDRPAVGFVGRITRQKGLVHLLRACQELPSDVQIVLLASAPDTPEIKREFSAELEQLRAARGTNVIWIPEMISRSELRQVVSHLTVFACPSIYEPMGIVNLEAMACQTAVVASRVGGIPEVVADHQTGLLVDYDPAQEGDPSYVADFETRFGATLNELLQDPARAAALGAAGRTRAITSFSWSAIAKQTIAVYQGAIAQYQAQH